jgi:hypothetical protein
LTPVREGSERARAVPIHNASAQIQYFPYLLSLDTALKELIGSDGKIDVKTQPADRGKCHAVSSFHRTRFMWIQRREAGAVHDAGKGGQDGSGGGNDPGYKSITLQSIRNSRDFE